MNNFVEIEIGAIGLVDEGMRNEEVYELVFQACEALELPNAVAAESMLIFFKIHSSVDEETLSTMKITILCSALVFLSSKINESHKSIRDIMNVICTLHGDPILQDIHVVPQDSLYFIFLS